MLPHPVHDPGSAYKQRGMENWKQIHKQTSRRVDAFWQINMKKIEHV